MSVSLIHLCRLFIISFKLRSWTLACVCRDQHFALMANKQTTFSCLQAVLTLTLADTVPLYFPVHQAMNTARNTHVKTLNHFAVPLDRVRAKEICQSNNEADVVVNLSVKFAQQTCGNYLCENTREYDQKFPKYSTTPPAKCFFFSRSPQLNMKTCWNTKVI